MARKKTGKASAQPFEMPAATDRDEIIIEGLRQNNLKNLSLRIPHDRITAIVGLSGSGKSSLAFDTLFAEGRWRFIESLSTYTRLFLERMDRPDLDSIRNIRPAIAVEQKNPVRTSRSTVGTATEINDYMRLFFARIGEVRCPACGSVATPSTPEGVADSLLGEHAGEKALIGFTLPVSGKSSGETAEEVLKKGFTRVRIGHRTHDLGLEALPEGIAGAVDVVADRVVLKGSERGRLVESLETAFSMGGGSAWAALPEKIETFTALPVCAVCGATAQRPTPISLSFNHPIGACPECKGFGNVLKYDEDKVVPDRSLTLKAGAIEPWTKPAYGWWQDELERLAPDLGIDLDKPFCRLTDRERRLVFEGTPEFEGVDGFFAYLESRKYKLHVKVFSSRYKKQAVCKACGGSRLKKAALGVTVNGLNIADASGLTIGEAIDFFEGLRLSPFDQEVSKEVLKQIKMKLGFLGRTGLRYLTLDRPTKTLSGGEAQRVSIATQLASALCGVLYILDEPSIGLHPVDIDMLSEQIRRLASAGNTVVTVEHDASMIMASDHIVELGPGAGERGGRLVYSGPLNDFMENASTLTSDYLRGRLRIHVPRWRRKGSGRFLTLKGASGNNLKDVDFKLPLRAMTCVTGVSGSGKSTLVVDTLYNVLAERFGHRAEAPLGYRSVEGLSGVTGVRLVDQGPVGRTPRSNPLTYIGGFDAIRTAFASTNQARARGFAPGRFSFNVAGGRCEACKGEGVEKLEMYFLPDVYIKCAECGGRRYKKEVLEVKYRGRSIYECLEMTFDEAAPLFPSDADLQKRFSVVRDVGLGYLKLGQSALTLSGGEAQRLKIARELVDEGAADRLYILDEPTTGLHMDDVKRLLSVLGRLVDAGNTVLLIEHNLDCIKTADHVVDLGPGGGDAGGSIVASGTPEEVAGVKQSQTGRYLKAALNRR